MSCERMAASVGPRRMAEEMAERLFCIAGALAKYWNTGGTLDAREVQTLVNQLDAAAAEADRMAREIGELIDMILDLAEEDDAPRGQIARLRPPLTVIPGGRGA